MYRCLDVVVKITRFIIGKTNMKSSSAAKASLSMLANTTSTLLFKKNQSSNGNKTLLLFDPYSNC